jgi:hypothetical protein
MATHLHLPGLWFPTVTAVALVTMICHGFITTLVRARRRMHTREDDTQR